MARLFTAKDPAIHFDHPLRCIPKSENKVPAPTKGTRRPETAGNRLQPATLCATGIGAIPSHHPSSTWFSNSMNRENFVKSFMLMAGLSLAHVQAQGPALPLNPVPPVRMPE